MPLPISFARVCSRVERKRKGLARQVGRGRAKGWVFRHARFRCAWLRSRFAPLTAPWRAPCKVEDVFAQNLLTRTSLPQANAYAMRWRQSRASPGLGTMSVRDRLATAVRSAPRRQTRGGTPAAKPTVARAYHCHGTARSAAAAVSGTGARIRRCRVKKRIKAARIGGRVPPPSSQARTPSAAASRRLPPFVKPTRCAPRHARLRVPGRGPAPRSTDGDPSAWWAAPGA